MSCYFHRFVRGHFLKSDLAEATPQIAGVTFQIVGVTDELRAKIDQQVWLQNDFLTFKNITWIIGYKLNRDQLVAITIKDCERTLHSWLLGNNFRHFQLPA